MSVLYHVPASVSTAIKWFSRTSRILVYVRSLCGHLVVCAWTRATLRQAFTLRFDPFFFLANRRWSFASFSSFFLNVFGAVIFSPSKEWRIGKPKVNTNFARCLWQFGSRIIAKHRYENRLAASFEIVTVVTLTTLGILRENMIAKASFIFPSVKVLPSHLKADPTLFGRLLVSFLLEQSIFRRLAKKLLNDICSLAKPA